MARRKKPSPRSPLRKSDPNRLTTKQQLADAFGASLPTIAKHCRRADFPGGTKGPWDRREVEIYLLRVGSPLVKPKGGADADAADVRRRNRELADEELLLKRANREKAEIDRDKLKETLIARDEALIVLGEICSKVRDQLMQWPDQATVSVPAEFKPVVIAELKRQVYRLLNNLAKEAETTAARGL